MKTFEEFNIINEDRTAPFDAMIIGLDKTDVAFAWSNRIFFDADNKIVYEITAELYVSSGYSTADWLIERIKRIDDYMKENFNFNKSSVSNALRSGNIGMSYEMTEKELETSKGFRSYIATSKYDL